MTDYGGYEKENQMETYEKAVMARVEAFQDFLSGYVDPNDYETRSSDVDDWLAEFKMLVRSLYEVTFGYDPEHP
jgi:hypothetical protein